MAMISKVLGVGNKIELTRSAAAENIEDARHKRTFISQILDIIDEEKMKIGMPMEQGKVIPLPINARLDACFYTEHGLYQCRLTVTDRYKEGSIFILVVELLSDLKKYQRRQYFRLGCVIDIKYRKIFEEEVEEYAENNNMVIEADDFVDGTALDISGGGIRFVSGEQLEKDKEIFIVLEITYEEQVKTYGLLGRVVVSYETKNHDGLYEHRVEFTNMQGGVRESLIKYIFEEERRQRQKQA
jgi:c-di-GMP-binding flagellar brake protein YcgR